jgi:hypothetical protein
LENVKGSDHMGEPSVDWNVILKSILHTYSGRFGLALTGSE